MWLIWLWIERNIDIGLRGHLRVGSAGLVWLWSDENIDVKADRNSEVGLRGGLVGLIWLWTERNIDVGLHL